MAQQGFVFCFSFPFWVRVSNPTMSMSRPGREQQNLAWARPTESGGSRSLAADRGAIRIQTGLKPRVSKASENAPQTFSARARKAARRPAVTAWPLILIGCASCRSGGVVLVPVLVLVLVMGLGLGQGPGLGLPSTGSIALRDVPTRTHSEVKKDCNAGGAPCESGARRSARRKARGGEGKRAGPGAAGPTARPPGRGGGTRRPRGVSRWPPAADRRCWLVVAWG